MDYKEFNNDNVVNFSKGKRLPSLEGMSEEGFKCRWERQEQLGITEIDVGGIFQLHVPKCAVENATKYLRTLDINERREVEKEVSERIEMFLDTVDNRGNLIEGVFERALEIIHKEVVLREGFNHLTVLER